MNRTGRFGQPVRPAIPVVHDPTWVRCPIDAFVLARLEAAGLQPSPEADRATLIRRVSLDLVGLPPRPKRSTRFVATRPPTPTKGSSTGCWPRRIMASAGRRRWLDLARYADTNGYEKDRPRSIWPYRDWVIRALNADMPFDRFTIEQLAGDMLPKAQRLEQRSPPASIATRCSTKKGASTRWNFATTRWSIGSPPPATVWLGLTVGCAQCHTHKYDPIPQREYYQFMAFLNNADEPEIEVPTPATTRRRQEVESQIAVLTADLPNQFPVDGKVATRDVKTTASNRRQHLERRFQEWLARASADAVRWTVLQPVRAVSNRPHLVIEPDGSILASGDQTKRDVYTVQLGTGLRGITAVRLEALRDDSLPAAWTGTRLLRGDARRLLLRASCAHDGRGEARGGQGGQLEQPEGSQCCRGRDRRRSADRLDLRR